MENKLILYFLILTCFIISMPLSYAQPKMPKEKIPMDIPMEVTKQIEKLYSQDPTERGYGAYYLGEMGKEASPAIPFLREVLDDDADLQWHSFFTDQSFHWNSGSTPGQEAAIALGKIGDTEFLIRILKDRSPNVTTYYSIIGLGQTKDSRAVEPLIAALNAKIAISNTADSLGAIGDRRAIEPLIAVLKDEYEAHPDGRSGSSRQHSAQTALTSITGHDFGKDPAKWQEWWEKNKNSFDKEK